MVENTPENPRTYLSGGQMLSGASNINIGGGTFIAHGSSETDEKKGIGFAMALLGSRAEKGAPYDAAAREDVPKCHEHTRVAIIDGIHNWAHDPNGPPLMWIYGPAGSGKTTIVQTVAETFDKEGSLAASFFFSRLSEARPETKGNFVITLAYQLTLHIPALQPLLADALSDLSLLSKSLVKQLDKLVIRPLNKLDIDQIGPRSIFLVDGLDECQGDAAQRDVLKLLERFLDQTQHRIRILVASRSLSHIQAFFSQSSASAITQTMPLDNDYQSNEDIREFLMSQFRKIHEEHPARSGLPEEWPPRSFIDKLVRRASGQFVYASVVMKFIAHHGRHPDQSLQTIIDLKVNDVARPYEELDALYRHVLSTIEPENIEFVQTLMGCLLMDKEKYFFARIFQTSATSVVDGMFMTPPGTTDARINRMHPIIVPKVAGGIQFAHASFPDYLLDQSRSREFFIDMSEIHCTLAQRWFELFTVHFQQNPSGGLVPSGAKDYRSPTPKPFNPGYIGTRPRVNHNYGEYGTILLDVLSHCQHAKWTSNLRKNVLTFHMEIAFKTDEIIRWWGIIAFLNFILWAKEHNFLAPADAEHLQHRIKSMVIELPISYAQRKSTAVTLTCYNCVNLGNLCDILEIDSDLVYSFVNPYHLTFDDNIHEASRIWLCKTLLPEVPINGPFFSDGSLYADAAQIYLHRTLQANRHDFIRTCRDAILILLSKATPSEELATILIQNFLQVQRIGLYAAYPNNLTEQEVEAIYIPICVYLIECYGIAFIAEHQHRSGYHSLNWVCGICMLFDAHIASECIGIELSKDPQAKLAVRLAPIAEGDIPELHPINHPQQVILGLPLFWLRTWIIWLADVVVHFFPVVA